MGRSRLSFAARTNPTHVGRWQQGCEWSVRFFCDILFLGIFRLEDSPPPSLSKPIVLPLVSEHRTQFWPDPKSPQPPMASNYRLSTRFSFTYCLPLYFGQNNVYEILWSVAIVTSPFRYSLSSTLSMQRAIVPRIVRHVHRSLALI